MAKGKVYLVGAGPGDPKLLTLRAVEVLRACHVVLVDKLVSREVLAYVREGAHVVDVGKRAGNHAATQERIHDLLIAYAQRGLDVVRLKGGDPFVFGRGGEEAMALTDAGIAWEIVPGVSAGVAAPAYAGIPVTHRGVASRVSFRTAHRADGAVSRGAADETVVLFMCGASLRDAAREIVAGGRSPATPIAIVRNGTRPDQEVTVATLADVIDGTLALGESSAPTMAIVGEVVALRDRLLALESMPLAAE
jgi:uroporphyrin-III C-methyltransferase